ncbi:cell wall-binding repeat-containing protein [Ornithinimicrobium cavernae]|uniref:cell wall-binding repeat-containing protein n=1 Tax=Ornithinimicrobium cavernae TaxID=2666047 RepID=UPI000D68EBEB|nr:cell wall-binding repeat-containing protein [Ornithinimicrobium cavernae]
MRHHTLGARGNRTGRRWLAVVVAGIVVAAGATSGSAGATAAPLPDAPTTADPADKLRPEVVEELDERGRATVLIRFAARPDLGPFSSIDDWDARGQAVYDALTSTADRTQAGVRASLERAGADFETFFISNAILVRGGDEALLTAVAADSGVEGVYLPTEYDIPEPRVSEADLAPGAVEWGIANINADDVWSEFGVTGEGLVIANIDTGVDYTHPALVGQYRGNNGDGTFDHNYNWFDAAGTGSDEPVDFEAHGTHTMGTMVGSDGGANQIGVAPGATWIAANGCCPSDAALIESGQWMLAPTDLAGENPLPAMRPHVINNSWGSTSPSNDPFMEDVAQAWEAAGIFGVWSNGNIGPDCETSGSPGSRTINYSVGAYDVANQIAGFSSRGAGQDGETKPNISAPGVGVRSAVPGGDYEAFDGTSMAAPHVAGTVALLWSAAPDLIGDTAFTKELLDGSATDTPDDQCGGTAEDNNVYGEGRLDALELLGTAPIGDTGRVEGTVTDASTDEPVAGATATFVRERTRSTTTAADGTYGMLLGTGDWDATISRFGYLPDSATVTVPLDETVVHDVALAPAPTGTLSGTVTDGSGQGWPLYARISVEGQPGVAAFTDPETGGYTLTLPAGTHVVRATSQLPGYLAEVREVVITDGITATEDFALGVDPITCNAPGYELVLDGLTQTFDEEQLPDGWTLEDLDATGHNWEFIDPWGIPNQTGGEGGFAVANSDFYPESVWDAVLVSPVVDVSTLENRTLVFKSYFDTFGAGSAAVELTTDGGTTWEPVWERTSFGIEEVILDLTGQSAGTTEIQVRFRYQAEWDLWWQVDDVFVGSRTCEPTGGGLVVGYVQDDQEGAGIVGARVTSLDNPGDAGTTRATPEDEGLEDGFYWLHSDLTGTHAFEATARNHGTDQQDVAVAAGGVARADFVLGAGVLEVDPTAIETTVVLGGSDTSEVTVTNTGTGTAELAFSERTGDFEILRADGSTLGADEVADSSGAPLVRREVDHSVSAYADRARPDAVTALPPRTAEEPWTDLAPLPVPLLDNRVVSLDGTWYSIGGTDGMESFSHVFRYDAAALTWVEVAALPAPAQLPVAAVVDGQIVVAGGWQNGDPTSDTWIYDPASDTWTAGAPMPTPVSSMGVAVADGLVYSIGGCTTGGCFPIVSTVQAYDPAADSWTESAPAPSTMAFPACGGIDGGIVCAGGVDDGEAELDATHFYDPAADTWSELADAPVAGWGAAAATANDQLLVVGGIQEGMVTNASWAYDPAGDSWSALPNANEAVYRGGGACGFARVGGDLGGFVPTDSAELLPGFDICAEGGADVEWLSLDLTEAVLEPGESVTVTVTTDSSAVSQPGTYTAGVGIAANVPERPAPVDVTMNVTPPLTWGKVTGTAYLEDCAGGQVAGDSITIDVAPVRDVGDGWVIHTDHEGIYARWINTQIGQLRMTALLEGYRPDTHLVDLIRGGTVVQDFSMLDEECQENPEPVPPEVLRVAGVDRYDTAARIAHQFAPGVDTVFVATGAGFPDALAAAARAGSLEGPVLLVKPSAVPAVTRIELDRLAPANVVIVGGDAAVSDDVEQELRAFLPEASFTRHAGSSRYDTAALIAGEFAASEVVYVATGLDYPDALAGAARAASVDAPVLLVKPDAVPQATVAQLERLGPERIVVLGGTSAVSEQVATRLGAYGTVDRVAGANRYETAAELAKDWETSQDIFVATGENWPDALAGAARAGATDAPVLLVKEALIPGATWAQLDRLDPGRIFVLGGTAAIGPEVLDRLRTLE